MQNMAAQIERQRLSRRRRRLSIQLTGRNAPERIGRSISSSHISRVVPIVMKHQRLSIQERLQRFRGIGKRRKYITSLRISMS